MMTHREPKTNRARRALKKLAPKVLENAKKALFLKGNKSSDVVNNVLTDLYSIKKPNAVKLWKKNDFYPFETCKNLEFLGFKNDTSLFCFGNHQKKRPHNLIFGRMFDFQLLDMLEMGVKDYEPMDTKKGLGSQEGNKPMFCFLGSHFKSNSELQRVQNMILDFFRGKEAKTINLAGLDRVICVSAKPPKNASKTPGSAAGYTIVFRQYATIFKKSGTSIPRVELEEIGPKIDFEVRRSRLAETELFKAACRLPKQLANEGKTKKNISKDGMGDVRGQIHVGDTDLSQLATRRFKAGKVNKKRERDAKAAAKEEAAQEERPKKVRKVKVTAESEIEAMGYSKPEKPKMRMKKDEDERTLFEKALKKKKVKQ